MKSLTERTTAALAWLDSQLAICNAATDGPWEEGGWSRLIKTSRKESIHVEHRGNHSFIAAARAGYPAMMEGMKVAIEGLREITTVEGPMRVWASDSLESILTRIEKLK